MEDSDWIEARKAVADVTAALGGPAAARLWIVKRCQGGVHAKAERLNGAESGYRALRVAPDFGLRPAFWADEFAEEGEATWKDGGATIIYSADWSAGVFGSICAIGPTVHRVQATGVRFERSAIMAGLPPVASEEDIRNRAKELAKDGMKKPGVIDALHVEYPSWPKTAIETALTGRDIFSAGRPRGKRIK